MAGSAKKQKSSFFSFQFGSKKVWISILVILLFMQDNIQP